MPRHNRNAWRNDQARADTQHQPNVVDLNRRRKGSKRARRLEKRRAA